MKVESTGKLLRIFIGEDDRYEGKPLFEVIVKRIRELGIAGATVIRGIEGYGAGSVIHKLSLLDLSADLPIVIEIVDSEEKILSIIPEIERLIEKSGGGALITLEKVEVIRYSLGKE
jgi:PII-like signaling protein